MMEGTDQADFPLVQGQVFCSYYRPQWCVCLVPSHFQGVGILGSDEWV